MGVIVFRCPRTGLDASTGVHTDQFSFEKMPEVQSKMTCPRCGAVHVWSKRWAVLTDDDDGNGLVEEKPRPTPNAA
jgi:hypothetical protein